MAQAVENVVLVRQAGKQLPVDVLAKALERYPSGFGIAMAADGKMDVMAEAVTGDKDLLLELVNQDYKDVDILLSFYKAEGELQPDDLQPLCLIGHTEKVKGEDRELADLVVCLTGQYTGADKPESTHTEFFFAASSLREEVLAIYEEEGKDVAKTLTKIDGPRFRRFAATIFTGDCTLTFMASNGKVATIKKTEKDKSHAWGWSSSDLFAAAPKKLAEGVHAVPEKGMTALEKLRAKKAGLPVTATAPAEVVEPEKKEEVVKTKPSVPSITGEPEDMKNGRFYPPAYIVGKAKRKWYGANRATGRLNSANKEDWEKNPGILPEELRSNSPLLHRLKSFQDMPRAAAAEANEGEAAPGHKDTETHIIPGPNDKGPGATASKGVVDNTNLPIIAPNMRESIMTDFLANRVVLVSDPAKAHEEELKNPSFVSQVNYDIGTALKWNLATMKLFCSRYPQAAAILMQDIRTELFKANPSLLKQLTIVSKGTAPKELTALEKLRLRKAG